MAVTQNQRKKRKKAKTFLVGFEIMETRAPLQHTVPRDDFCTKGGRSGVLINLGHFKKHNPDASGVYKNTFTVHDTSTNDAYKHQVDFEREVKGGLGSTRFGKGFQRRSASNISNPIRDERLEVSREKERMSQTLSASRSDLLKTIDNYNGFDIITGSTRDGPGGVTKPRVEGIRRVGDGLGPEAPQRAHIILRDSSSRFFTPQYSGPHHEYRQHVLVTEGLKLPKASSTIQLGKKDNPSSGVEDQFSKSDYTKKAPHATFGLVETTAPGRFTPRKQTGNPSGDPSVTASWGKGVLSSSMSGSASASTLAASNKLQHSQSSIFQY